MSCPPCNHNCQQSDTCPARKAASMPSEPAQDFDPIPRMGSGLRVVRWIGLGLMVLITLVWVAGLAGFLYARHQGA